VSTLHHGGQRRRASRHPLAKKKKGDFRLPSRKYRSLQGPQPDEQELLLALLLGFLLGLAFGFRLPLSCHFSLTFLCASEASPASSGLTNQRSTNVAASAAPPLDRIFAQPDIVSIKNYRFSQNFFETRVREACKMLSASSARVMNYPSSSRASHHHHAS
jgi:hypothetical protein